MWTIMRGMSNVATLLVFMLGVSMVSVRSAPYQASGRLNPIIALQEKGLPIFGISHPAIMPRRAGPGGGLAATPPATPPPPIVLADVAKETVAYTRADYLYTSGTSDTFLNYLKQITAAGGSARTHPFVAKIGVWHANPEASNAAIVRQLNAGHMSVDMEAVESVAEVRDVVKAMRFTSAGGTRPDTGLENAAAYWGLSVGEYMKKADVWPLNPNGELFIAAIIESLPGLEKVREIAADPAVAQIFAGYGTLGGVFRGDPAGREAAAATILAACKEFKKPCGFPVNNPQEMTQRVAEGWTVFIMQRRDEAGLAAVETGRTLGKR